MNDDYAAQKTRFVTRIRQLRQAQGMSARELAERMEQDGFPWKREIVANLEHGRRSDVKLGEALQLCRIFGVELPAMLSGEPLKITVTELVI